MSIEKERLNLLFEMETIKSHLMPYIAPGVSLKVVADLGYKDQNGNKRRFYEETRYKSNKYKNTDYLVSANFRINTYLALEYPNPNYTPGSNSMRSHVLFIRAYAMDDIVSSMKAFNDKLSNSYGMKDGKLYVLADKVKDITVFPSINSTLNFKTDIYENKTTDKLEMGVRITINEEFSTIVSAETTWPELLYRMSKCDLTTLGYTIIQSYVSLLQGMAVSEIGNSNYTSASRYTPYWEDPDDIVNGQNSVNINKRKPLTKEEKTNDFFNNL